MNSFAKNWKLTFNNEKELQEFEKDGILREVATLIEKDNDNFGLVYHFKDRYLRTQVIQMTIAYSVRVEL